MVFDAARDGARRARDAGATSIALALSSSLLEVGGDFADALHVAVSGVLYGLYAPIQERDHAGDAAEPVTRVGVFAASVSEDSVADAIRRAVAVDLGRRLACDLVRSIPAAVKPLAAWLTRCVPARAAPTLSAWRPFPSRTRSAAPSRTCPASLSTWWPTWTRCSGCVGARILAHLPP